MEIKTIGHLLESVAKKAGIEPDDPNLISLLSNADVSKITVHTDVSSAIDNNLLSFDQALDNHPKVKNKYKAEVMNAFDVRIKDAMEQFGLSDEQKTALTDEKSTFRRFEQLFETLKETTKPPASPAEDKTGLQKQVDELLAANKQAQKEAAQRVAQIEQERRNDRIKYELKGMLGPIKTVFDDLPSDAKAAAIDSIINKALQDKGASFDFDEAGSFILKGKDDTAVVGANSTKYDPQSFIDEILAQNKVLKVTEKTDTTTQQTGNNQRVTTVDASQTALKGNNQTTANLNRANREAAEKQFSQA